MVSRIILSYLVFMVATTLYFMKELLNPKNIDEQAEYIYNEAKKFYYASAGFPDSVFRTLSIISLIIVSIIGGILWPNYGIRIILKKGDTNI